eukprot:PLAT1139.1.p1 GENE.PLAT1139.1~~PLAT1139.1.p1  ORF type:complete len:871 (-),score=441.44 PLAT1139.1:127-2739(-)
MIRSLLLLAAVAAAVGGHGVKHECGHDKLIAGLAGTPRVFVAQDYGDARRPIEQAGRTSDTLLRGSSSSTPASGRRMQSVGTEYAPIRMRVDYKYLTDDQHRCTAAGRDVEMSDSGDDYECTSADVLTDGKEQAVRAMMASARGTLQTVLSVLPLRGPLLLAAGFRCSSQRLICCDSRDSGASRTQVTPTIPAEALSPGYADTDFVVYVTARPAAENLLAWALTCQRDQWGRPIAAQINFAPATLPSSADDVTQQHSGIATHEMLHALGISADSFPLYREARNGASRQERDILETYTEHGKRVQKLITPEVQAWTALHFGCAAEQWNAGAQLEEFGGSASAGSHWERRLFGPALMTATAVREMILSGVTLAALADSGWYRTQPSQSQFLAYGEGQGCSFVQDTCADWLGAYRCTASGQTGCSPDHRQKASCNVVENNPPDDYEWLPDGDEGGADPFADYCPMQQEITVTTASGQDVVDCRGTAFGGPSGPGASGAASYLRADLNEEVATNGRCFDGSFQLGSAARQDYQFCYDVVCTASSGTYTVTVADSTTVNCGAGGSDVSWTVGTGASAVAGTISCPPMRTVCGYDSCAGNCGNFGTCSSGTCTCLAGRTGSNCEEYTCANDCSGHGSCATATGICTCASGFYGIDCAATQPLTCPHASCSGHGTCNVNHGVCDCTGDYRGPACEQEGDITYTTLEWNDEEEASVARGAFKYFRLTSDSPNRDLLVTVNSTSTVSYAASFITSVPSPEFGGLGVLTASTAQTNNTGLLLCAMKSGSRGEGARACTSATMHQFYPPHGTLFVAVHAPSGSGGTVSFTITTDNGGDSFFDNLSSNIGSILGGVFGGIAAIACLACCWSQRRRLRKVIPV